MIEAVINAGIFKDIVDAVACLVDECKLNYTPDGIKVAAVDPANVAMVHLDLGAASFQHYEANRGTIAVDLVKMKDALAGAAGDDTVEIKVLDGGKLVLRYGATTYRLSLLDPGSIRKEPKKPFLDHPVKVVINGSDLKRMVKSCDKVAKRVRFESGDGFFSGEAETELDSVRIEYAEAFLVSLQGTIKVESIFGIDYLNDIMKAAGSADQVSIELGDHRPAWFSFKLASGNCSVSYLLAPWVEDEDEEEGPEKKSKSKKDAVDIVEENKDQLAKELEEEIGGDTKVEITTSRSRKKKEGEAK
jgi:proliferating cell nuclear antigen